jgi:hypothetical protein
MAELTSKDLPSRPDTLKRVVPDTKVLPPPKKTPRKRGKR